jgi:ribonucleoside-triphosphate reductase
MGERFVNPAGRNRRSVWTVSTSPYKGAHYACVDTETEALTRYGWKKEFELQDGDEIAVYNKNKDTWEWGRARFFRYNYSGSMVSIEKRETSQLLTPEHRCIIRRRMGHRGRDGWDIDVKQAKELNSGYELLLSAAYDELLSEESTIGVTMSSLLGWVVTDGGIREDGSVRIYQSISANKEKCQKIRELLDSCGANYTEFITKKTWKERPANIVTWTIVGTIARKIIELVPNKKLTPELVMGLSLDEAISLFESIVSGDGCRRYGGRIQIIQKDKTHIDIIQMLAVRLGYKTVLSHRKDDNCYCLYITRKKWLTLRGANGSHNPLLNKEYNGIVWCPSVDTGFWIARRNGRVFITGNTFPPKLIEPMILAGCPSGGIVLDPFVGSGTTVMVANQLGRRGVGLDLSFKYLQENAKERIEAIQPKIFA